MPSPRKFALSQDVWAVILSIALALLVRTGIIAKVTW